MEAQGHILIRRKAKNGLDGAPGAPGRDGSAGLDGVILWPSEWAANIAYRNETSKTTSPRYVDVVYIQNKALASGWDAYICKQSHTSSTSNKPNGSTTTYWEKVSNFSAIMAPIILGKNSFINFMQGNRIQIENANGSVAAGMCAVESSTANTVIWAGGTYEGRASAPFHVDSDGKVTAANADITGTVNASKGQIGGFKIEGDGLTNTGFDNNAYIILRNDTQGTFVGIGANVISAVLANLSAVGIFRNEKSHASSLFNFGTNYGIIVSAKNGNEGNIAVGIEGGSISGLALKTKNILTEAVTSAATKYVTLDRETGCVLVTTACTVNGETKTRDVYITLPTLQAYDDGHVIKIKRGMNNGNDVYIRPASGNCIQYDATSVATYASPLKIDSEGDAMELVYFSHVTTTSGSTRYSGTWVQFKNPRDW